VRDDARLVLDRAEIRDIGGHAVSLRPRATLSGHDVAIGPTFGDDAFVGVGIFTSSGTVDLDRLRITGSARTGIVAFAGAARVLVRDLDLDGAASDGIELTLGAHADLDRARIADFGRHGIYLHGELQSAASSTARLTDLVIEGPVEGGGCTTVAPDIYGMRVKSSVPDVLNVEVERFSISDVEIGIWFEVLGEGALADGAIRESLTGLKVRQAHPPERLLDRVTFQGNCVDLEFGN
jgi:hypothetical protein